MGKAEVTEKSKETAKQALLSKAEQQGCLTLDDMMEAFPEAEENLGELEDLLIYLNEEGIQIVYDEEAKEEVKAEAAEREEEEILDLSEIASDDTISLYLKEMARVPLLTAEEEIRLAKQYEQGRTARRRLSRNGQEPDEHERLEALVERGEAARAHLIKAVEKFDYRRGHRFSTYATWWIRQAITRALADQGRVIRLPVHLSDRIRKVYQTSQQLEQDWGRQPTPEEIASELGLPPQKVQWMLKVSQRPLSLEKPVGEEEDSELGSFIEDSSSPTPTDSAYHHLLQEKLEDILTSLTPREARILRLRFGLQDGRSYTLEEVGQKFGLTRERIRQIEHEALDRLRHPSRSRQLRDYLT